MANTAEHLNIFMCLEWSVKDVSGKVEVDTKKRAFVSIPATIMKKMGWTVGDWLEVVMEENVIKLRKVHTVPIQVKLSPEIMEEVYRFRDEEGYYTDKEALTNLVQLGIASYFVENGGEEERKKAKKLFKSRLLQIRS